MGEANLLDQVWAGEGLCTSSWPTKRVSRPISSCLRKSKAVERPLGPHPHLTWPEVLLGPVLLPLLGWLWFLVLVESTKHRGSTSHLVEREKRSNSEGDIR